MIYLNATHLAVELAVVDIEGQRLSERPFNVRLELFHLFGDLKKRQLVTLVTLSFTRCMYLNWVLVKDKLHKVGVLEDEDFDVGKVSLRRVR